MNDFWRILSKLGQNPGNNVKKLVENPQLEMFKTVLTSFIHPDRKLCLLAKEVEGARNF